MKLTPVKKDKREFSSNNFYVYAYNDVFVFYICFIKLKGAAASEPQNKKKGKQKKLNGSESGFSSDGSQVNSRKRTPMTLPRTKVTTATPFEQQIALKRLKQRLLFDEQVLTKVKGIFPLIVKL